MTATACAATDRYGFPIQTCGRCGGTGQFSYNQMHGSRCYGCNGRGVRHTREAGKQFQAWSHDLKQLRQALGKNLKVGDELAIEQATGLFSAKLLGWHTVTSVHRSDKACGWSIRRTNGGAEIKLPSMWEMTVTFDDGDTAECSTQTCFRRKGWIDPAPYIAKIKA